MWSICFLIQDKSVLELLTLFSFTDLINCFFEMSCNDFCEGFLIDQVVTGGQQMTNGWVQSTTAEEKGIQSKLEAQTRVAFVVGKLNVGHQFLQGVECRILLVLVCIFCFDDLGKHLFEAGNSFRNRAISDFWFPVVGNDKSGSVKGQADFDLVARLHRLGWLVQKKRQILIFHGGVNVELLLDLLDGGLLERVGLGHQLSKVVVHRSEHVVPDGGQSAIFSCGWGNKRRLLVWRILPEITNDKLRVFRCHDCLKFRRVVVVTPVA